MKVQHFKLPADDLEFLKITLNRDKETCTFEIKDLSNIKSVYGVAINDTEKPVIVYRDFSIRIYDWNGEFLTYFLPKYIEKLWETEETGFLLKGG